MNVLYIEDDPGLAKLGKRTLEKKGFAVELSGDLAAARQLLARDHFDCVLTDYMLPDGLGTDLLTEHKAATPDSPWIVITGVGSETLAVEALKKGASDYIVKDLEAAYLDLLPSSVQRAIDIAALARKKASAERELVDTRDRLRTLFDASIDLLVVCDEHRICTEVSDQALPAYSITSANVLGKDVFNVFGISDHAARLEDLKNGRTNELELDVALGFERVPMSIRARTLNDGQTLLSFRDIRERHALHDAQETVDRVVAERDRYEASSKYLSQELKRTTQKTMLGTGERFKAVLRTIEQAAQVDAAVLVTGETGTGKELVADMLHELSHRAEHNLIKVNCAVLPAELVESELFGHVKGSFTGAFQNKVGRFETAHNGTLVLDEIGEFPLALQAKLLRALQSGEFQRIGSNDTKRVDVRVVALTNRNLTSMIERGKFREDLYYRLNVIPIQLPALRERGDDVRLLFDSFVRDVSNANGQSSPELPNSVYEQLVLYDWPGNIRELRNYVERGLAIGTWMLPKKETEAAPEVQNDRPLNTLAQNEKQHILKALAVCNGVISGKKGAASLLDINANTLRARMDKLGIRSNRSHA